MRSSSRCGATIRAPGLYRTNDPTGAPWRVAEGGGLTAVSGYGCIADHDQQQTILVNARDDGDPGPPNTYTGTRVAYTLENGIATPTATRPIDNTPRQGVGERADGPDGLGPPGRIGDRFVVGELIGREASARAGV